MMDLHDLFGARRWTALAGLAVVMALYVLVAEVVPRGMTTRQLLQARALQEEERQLAEQWPQELARIEDEHRKLQSSFAAAFVHVPQRDQLSLIVRVLQETAGEAGIELLHLKPQEAEVHPTYEVLPIRLRATGRYHAVATFIDQIEHAPYLLNLSELQLTAYEDAGSVHAALVLTATFLR